MQEIIGFGSLNLLETGEMKKASLMFDKIAFPLIELELELQARLYSSMAAIAKENTLEGNLFALEMMKTTLFQINNIEYLEDKKIIFTPNLSDFDKIANKKSKGFVKKYYSESNSLLDKNLGLMRIIRKTSKKMIRVLNKKKIWNDISTVFDRLQIAIEHILRASSFMYQELTNSICVPIISTKNSFKDNGISKVDVMQLTLNALPIPDDSVAWEEIFNFRNDPDSKSKFLALRNWMNEIATGQLLPTEIEEKLEYLLDQYENHMKLHKMKYHKGVLETLITTTAEVAENLVRLKFSKIAQLPFTIKNKKLTLMEEEMKSPGKEVAYISKARTEFLNKNNEDFNFRRELGFVGKHLIPTLLAKGHEVYKLVRRTPKGADEIQWNAEKGFSETEQAKLENFDAVVHLAGDNVASENWSDEKKRKIKESRTVGTRVLVDALKQCVNPPKHFISASAIGFYGNRGTEILNEESAAGNGFLTDVCVAWENEIVQAEAFARIVFLRIGVVLAKDGGALEKMLTPFKFGLGGAIGSGEQYMSWIVIDDLIKMIHFVLGNENLRGAVNAVAPNAVTNAEFVKTLGKVLNRPTVLPMPEFAIKMLFGEMGETLLLEGARVYPQKLLDAKFDFDYPNLEDAMRHVIK